MSSAKWRPFCSGFIVLSMSCQAPKSIDKAVNTSQAALSGDYFLWGMCKGLALSLISYITTPMEMALLTPTLTQLLAPVLETKRGIAEQK